MYVSVPCECMQHDTFVSEALGLLQHEKSVSSFEKEEETEGTAGIKSADSDFASPPFCKRKCNWT